MKQFKGILLAMISSATFGMIPLFALPVIRGGMGVDSVMFYRFALSSAVVGAYLLLGRTCALRSGNSACCSDWGRCTLSRRCC